MAQPNNYSDEPSATSSGGQSAPLGATTLPDGVNFSLFSRRATAVDLLLFDQEHDTRPARVIPIECTANRSYHYWHVFVPGLRPGQVYGYRVHGPFDPASGARFDPSKLLLDPYARAVLVPTDYRREAACGAGDNTANAMKSVVINPQTYNWEGDAPLHRPPSRTIIYEMHVRGFTRHPSSGLPEQIRGTYAGLIGKVPYLERLGITAVELMPVFQYDARDAPAGLTNYWGYAPVSFFAPHQAYSSRRDPLAAVDEFRDMVKALHRAGIEVILDVVFNHTAEGNDHGPTLNFRGVDNETYYILEHDRSRYADYSGTGNTLNANHPVVRRMILDSLRYWVQEMHVDGFRFDLASILSRDDQGNPIPNPPVLWDIESDPLLADTKLIAEAWDAAGLYQVGSFAGDAWREWNGRFRDDVRSFFRGDDRSVVAFADRITGSPQIYGHKNRPADESVNFITSHDGFTLNDLVSYREKHNDENREGNRDGTDDNRSANWGHEGPTDDPIVECVRRRQIKNFIVTTLLSLGMPMVLMGDEVRRTQQGNNNAYCQDNDISWFDWTLVEKHADIHRFVTVLTAGRARRDRTPQPQHQTLHEVLQSAVRSWHGVNIGRPDWSDTSHSIALSTELPHAKRSIYTIFNAYWQTLEFELPAAGSGGKTWRRWIDTGLDSPDDIIEWDDAPPISGRVYRAEPHSLVFLFTE